MGKASTPAAPDYTAAAQATAQGNLQNAQLATQANRPNMDTPWGSSTWTQTPQYDMNAYTAAMAKYPATPSSSSSPVMTSDGVPITTNGNMGQSQSGIAPQLSDYANGSTWANNVNLSPSQQSLFDQQNQLQQGLFGAQNNALSNVSASMSQPMTTALDPNSMQLGSVLDMNGLKYGDVLDINSLPTAGTALRNDQMYDPTKSTNNATDLIMQRINPQLDRQQTSLNTQLTNQGIAQGSDAWNNAIESFGRSRNDAQNQAALTGINLGMQQSGLSVGQQGQQYNQQNALRQLAAALQGQRFGQQDTNLQRYLGAQNQQFNQTNANAGLFGQLQGQGFNQANYLRDLPMNELNALRAGNQVTAPQFQSFANQGYVPGADYSGAANANYQAALGNSNAQNASANNTMGGLFGLGTSALLAPAGTFSGLSGLFGGGAAAAGSPEAAMALFSDRRTKTDIVRVGRADNGLGIYSYRYKWGGPTMLGYMADEVEKIAPHAVGEVGGFKTVDYARV